MWMSLASRVSLGAPDQPWPTSPGNPRLALTSDKNPVSEPLEFNPGEEGAIVLPSWPLYYACSPYDRVAVDTFWQSVCPCLSSLCPLPGPVED